MDADNREVPIQQLKMEFPSGNHCETDVENMNRRNIGPEHENSDTEIEMKPSLPLYNFYPVIIKDEVNDPDPPFSPLTSVVKSETDIGQPDTQYFDHSSIIIQNLKAEPDDEAETYEDPLSGADSVPVKETLEISFQALGENPIVKIDTGEESNFCRLCKQSFSGNGECEREKRCEKCLIPASIPIEHRIGGTTDKKKRYKCETCGKGFATSLDVSRHARTHTGEKPFECETCGKCFGTTPGLTYHLRTHTGEKPFNCGMCEKSFTDSSNLKRHQMSHSGEKPFECKICGKGFVQRSTLAEHFRTHTRDKPFECETCGKCFTRSPHLAAHMRTHSGQKPFECDICSKSFASRAQLTSHEICHSGDKTFKCEICGKCLARKQSWKHHMKLHV